jgi:hypothetical protein
MTMVTAPMASEPTAKRVETVLVSTREPVVEGGDYGPSEQVLHVAKLKATHRAADSARRR